MRFWAMLMVVLLVFTDTASAATRQRKVVKVVSKPRATVQQQDAGFDPKKYAALVMDARTGEVLHARNADAARYPASLTKMMTLYLLFEALENKKVTLKSTMVASRRASQQPQTNISLKPGERIPVDTAIRALVVRSANDVAVVVAERLGGSVENFAVMMTRKAKTLGMNNTVFKNPNGLPDYSQHTTARDMAKLAVALRRDFPQYYDYFAVRQFSWKRVSYYTHNRVMMRYAGADGIKTGFINASGFNVVTSVRRNGRSIVGVVFGGNTAAIRDDRMIALIENAEEVLASRGNSIANLQPRNLPAPVTTPPAPVAVAKPVVADDPNARGMQTAAPVRVAPPAPAPEPRIEVSEPAPAVVTTKPSPTAGETVVVRAPAPAPAPAVPANAPFAVQSQADRYAMRQLQEAAPAAGGAGARLWGIQVGAFEDRTQAEDAAKKAFAMAARALQGANLAVAGAGMSGKTIHRARLENVTENQARAACQTLISQQSPCFIYRVN